MKANGFETYEQIMHERYFWCATTSYYVWFWESNDST
jgi:hypothetical protein